jgi:O-antigen ligase
MNKLYAIDKYAARVLMLSFFLPMYWQVQVVGVACLYFVFRVFLTKQFVPKGNYLWALFLGSVFLLYLFSVPFTPPEFRKIVWHQCEHRVAYFLMPFLFAIVSPRFRDVIMGEIMYFVYGCFIACTVANADIMYHYFFVKGDHILNHVAYRTMIHAVTDIHPTYLSMYLCFSICILLLASKLAIRVHPAIINTLLFFLFIFLLALGAKTPIIALVLVMIHFVWAHRKNLYAYKWLFIGMPVALIAAWIFIPFLGQRLSEMTQLFNKGGNKNIVDNSVAARQMIWSMDIDLLKQYWLTGLGPANINTAVEQQSYIHSLSSGVSVLYHDPHNEYFYEWISFGIVGIGLLVLTLFVQFRQAIRSKDHLYLYLLIILCATFLTESVLSLQRGVLFYAVFAGLMYFTPLSPKGEPRI